MAKGTNIWGIGSHLTEKEKKKSTKSIMIPITANGMMSILATKINEKAPDRIINTNIDTKKKSRLLSFTI